jgi:hypothetical protein
MPISAEDMAKYITFVTHVMFKQIPEETVRQIWDLRQREAVGVICDPWQEASSRL